MACGTASNQASRPGGRNLGVPQPLTALTREIVQSMIGNGYQDSDFGALLELEAKAAGLELKSENKMIDDRQGGKS
jgi:3-hydroxyisobutyrate dehydrogenase